MRYPPGDGTWTGFGPGEGSTAGPSPDAVGVVAQRLLGIAGEFSALQLQLDRVAATDWRSPAASAFRNELQEQGLGLAAAVRSVEDAAAAVGRYGVLLASGGTAAGCLGPFGAGGFPFGMPGPP